MIYSIACRSKILQHIGFTTRAGILTHNATRDISIGSDLSLSQCTFQKARPWHMDDTKSNLAKDNAVTTADLFKNKKVAIFGVPAPFTGTCTTAHYPPYKALQDDF